jgi:hypothetical protein
MQLMRAVLGLTTLFSFVGLALAEKACLPKPDFMDHEHFTAFVEADMNGDLSLSPAEMTSSASGDEVSSPRRLGLASSPSLSAPFLVASDSPSLASLPWCDMPILPSACK